MGRVPPPPPQDRYMRQIDTSPGAGHKPKKFSLWRFIKRIMGW